MSGTVDLGSASGDATAAKQTTLDKREAHSDETDQATKKPRTESVVSSEKSAEEKEKKTIEFNIEADVAEDKGSRHTMEDAWVVLLDASSDSPGNLRFSTSSMNWDWDDFALLLVNVCLLFL